MSKTKYKKIKDSVQFQSTLEVVDRQKFEETPTSRNECGQPGIYCKDGM